MEAQLARTARNATAIALSTFLARGIQAAWVILLARLIGDASYGTWGTVGALISTVAAISEFGMGLIVLRDVAQHPHEAGRYLTATLVAQSALSAVAYILLIVIGLILPNDSATRLLIVLAGLSLIVDSLGNMGFNQLLAAEQMVTTSAITVLHIMLTIAFALTVVVRGGGLAGLYIATIVAGFLRVIMFWTQMARRQVRPVWPVDWSIIRRLFRDGSPLALGSFFSLAYQNIDKVLVYTFLSAANAGYLTSAFVIVFGVVDLSSTTVLTALFPLMSRMVKENPGELRALTNRLAILMLAITLPMGIVIAALSPTLAALLFPGFAGTAGVLQILIWHIIPMIVATVYGQWMIVENRQRRRLVIQVLALAINIALNFFLLPRFGVQGAGVAILVAQTAMLLFCLLDFQPDAVTIRKLGNHAARIGLAGAAMAVCVYGLRVSSPFVAGIVGACVYPVMIVLLRAFAPDHWAILRGAAVALPVIGPILKRRLPLPASLPLA